MFLKIWQDFIDRKVFSYFILLLLITAGSFSLLNLPKESAPEVQVPIAIITTTFSGATASEIEEQITIPMEDSLDSVNGIKSIESTSENSHLSIVVQFKQGENIDEKIDEIKEQLDTIKNKLPKESKDYSIHDMKFSDQPIFTFTIASNQNLFDLKKTVDQLQDIIENISGSSTVSYSGLPDYEVSIFLDHKSIEKHNLSFNEILNTINNSNVLSPVGSLSINNQEYKLSLNTKIKNTKDLENIIIKKTSTSLIYLKDISTITEGFAQKDITSSLVFSEKNSLEKTAIVFSVSKESGYNILKLTDDLQEVLKKSTEKGEILENIDYKITLNLGSDAKKDMWDLSINGLTAVGLVFLILIFVLGAKDAFVAAIGIPLSFLLAFIFFNYLGNTLNFISLFSMILSIGILVDSDIVITEGIANKKSILKEEEEEKPEGERLSSEKIERIASKHAVVEFAGPMLAGTITTIAVFSPLFFLSGVTGDFIKGIPFTVVFILIASQIISIFVIPLLHSSNLTIPFLKYFKNLKLINFKFKIKKFDFIKSKEKYKKILKYFFIKKKRENIFIFVVVLFFFITLLLPIMGLLKAQFFPGGDVPYIYSDIELQKGSTKIETEKILQNLKEIIKEENFYSSMILTRGKTSEFNQNGSLRGDRFANILLNIKEDQKKFGNKHLTELRNKIDNSNLKDFVNTSSPEGGPPTGSPVDFHIVSNNFNTSKEAALLIENILRKDDNILNIKTDLDKNNTGFEIIINREKAALLNMSLLNVTTNISAITSGIEIFELKEDGESIKTYLKIKKTKKTKKQNEITPDILSEIKIKNNLGKYVYLSSFSTIVPKSVNSKIYHLDKKVSINITADNKINTVLSDIISNIKKEFEIQNKTDAKIIFGGAFAEQEQSFGETGVAFAGGIALIFAILIFLFNSIRLPMIIESVIPLAFSGVIVGLYITGNMLSFPAILGFIALSGIVVNNSIILIYIYEKERNNILKEKNKISNKDIEKIVIDGSISRLRPILLTTITTIVGVIPLLFSSATWAPIAYTIISGLIFATIITLIFIPILYKKFYPKK